MGGEKGEGREGGGRERIKEEWDEGKGRRKMGERREGGELIPIH